MTSCLVNFACDKVIQRSAEKFTVPFRFNTSRM